MTTAKATATASPTLKQVMAMHHAGQLEAAEPHYRRLMLRQAGDPNLLHFYGLLCHQRGRSDEGVALIRRALKRAPGYVDAHHNLGLVLTAMQRPAEAEAAYREALRIAPGFHKAIEGLARSLEAQKRWNDALHQWQRLVREAPQYPTLHLAIGSFLRRCPGDFPERLPEAARHLRLALDETGAFTSASEALGQVLHTMGDVAGAREVYRNWAARHPDDPIARHLLAAAGGTPAPGRADDAYVRQLFDTFAADFDHHLVDTLAYRAPEVLVAALRARLPANATGLDVLDAGCGTGLCAPLLRPIARRLVGVDLSTGMVEKARLRGGYDQLDVAELTAHLAAQPAAWDVVLSADTLIYFGDLGGVFAAAHAALRPGGWLAFTLEELAPPATGHALGRSGRYQHARDHIGGELARHGFIDTQLSDAVLRKENGQPVAGLVIVTRRAA